MPAGEERLRELAPGPGDLALDSKLAKTERNRLRLILRPDEEALAKERRVAGDAGDAAPRTRKSSLPRYRRKQPQQQQQQLQEGEGTLGERRRPVSLHGPREDILFGSSSFGLGSVSSGAATSWRPASSIQLGASLAPAAERCKDSSMLSSLDSGAQRLRSELGPMPVLTCRDTAPQVGRLQTPREQAPEHGSGFSTPESYANKSGRSYEYDGSSTEEDSRPSSSLQSQRLPPTHGTWSVKQDLWGLNQSTGPVQLTGPSMHNELLSLMSFSSDTAAMNSSSGMQGQRRLGAKMDVVYSLLSMLGSTEGREDMSATLLSMSNSVDSCIVMRQSGCLPLLIQLIHAPGQDAETRERASRALYNIVHAKNDEKMGRREARVLRLLEQLRDFCQSLRNSLETRQPPDDLDGHPGATIAALMKLSFDESHRHAMCQLGGLHAVAELIEMDHAAHGSGCEDPNCITLRRYAGMALTNLTFGDGNNKALLCSFHQFMKALVSQLGSPSDDLRQVTASVLRNLSWRADSSSKQTLREVGAVVGLMKAAMEGRKESTLKSILSALWNLSAHCSTNKMDICAVEGALAFLVDMLSYNAPSKTLAIVENAGGILRNVSSHIAVRDDYRAIVRDRGCLQVLLRQLRSPSLTVVSNACGALWNLSARCPQDQRLLWDLGAVPMLRSLVPSKHKMISMGSSAALKNLLSARPNGTNMISIDSTARGLGLPTLPSLTARRQKALEQEIDQNLAETCDNIEPSTSPLNKEDKFTFKIDQAFLETPKSGRCFHQSQVTPPITGQPGPSGIKYAGFTRSESRESMRSVTSTHSDTVFEKVNRQTRNSMAPSDMQVKQQSASLHSAINFEAGNGPDRCPKGLSEKKYTLRYMHAIPERLKPGEPLPDLRHLKSSTSTVSWTTAPNQDATFSKGLLHSSVDDNLSLSNSCESTNSKTDISSDSNSCNNSHSGIKSTSSFNDYSLKYAEQTSDDDKQSSAYFTSNEQDQDTVKTYCTEGTPYQGSLNSSRASSASDIRDESKTKTNFKRNSESNQTISCNGSKLPISNRIFERNSKLESEIIRINSRQDSLRSTNSESTVTLGAGRSLESDSAIFEVDHKFGESSGVPSLSSLVEDEPKIIDESQEKQISSMQYEADTESFPESLENISDENEYTSLQNNTFKPTLRKNDYNKETHYENNLVRYTTNLNLNDIEIDDINDDIMLGNRPTPLTSLESEDQQSVKDDGDYSEVTYTNDYYTVQETFTLETDNDKVKQKTFPNDDCSLSQQCFSTLSYMSVNEKEPGSNIKKTEIELVDRVTGNATPSNSESCESFDSIERSEQALLELCIKSGPSKPEKYSNVDVTDAPKNSIGEDITDTSKQTIVLSNNDENIFKSFKADESVGKCQDEYRRQRDPDAMIASLDRLTATLVQQTEAMRERDSSAMKASLLSDTWNEDSPNEVSFPSISASVPLVSSFKSDIQDDQVNTIADLTEHSSIPISMTESRIIEIEAIKLAEAVSAEANQVSLASIDLDAINPPSTMGSLLSLTASIGGITENGDNSDDRSRGNSSSLPRMQISKCRKKSLPIGLVARRALNYGQNRTGSLESLFDVCNNGNISQLENVKPPSIMDELLDMGDMENSMLSVASITSEVADSKDNDSNPLTNRGDTVFDLVKPMSSVLSMTCLKYSETMHSSGNNSLTECLENINPPSLFNEVSQMDESTIDGNTHCSDTLCMDAEFFTEEATHCVFDERIEEIANDTDEGATPLSSEHCSSVESTPKKRPYKNHSGHLTPKQKRQLAKERYKTYTIAAERVKKEQEDRRKQEQANENISSNVGGKCSPFSKLTPKQRRQEDRARFQTQVLGSPIFEKNSSADISGNDCPKVLGTEKTGIQSLVKTGIPMLKKFGFNNKTCKINQIPDQEDRYRTMTLNHTASNHESHEEQKTTANNVMSARPETKNETGFSSNGSMNVSRSNSVIEQSLQLKFVNGVSKKLNKLATTVPEFSHETQYVSQDFVIEDTDDLDDSQTESEDDLSAKDERPKIARPRIVKPGTLSRNLSIESNATDKSEPEAPKGIRGRRKPLYSTPNTRKLTPQTSPLKQASLIGICRSNTSPIVRATRATTLRQNNSTQKIKGTMKTSAVTNRVTDKRPSSSSSAIKRSSIPQKSTTPIKRLSPQGSCVESDTSKTLLPPIKPLERQGTFTKDEPEVENAPTVLPMSSYKSNLSKQDNSTKTSPVHGKSKISLRTPQRSNLSRLTKTTSVEKLATPTNIPTIAKRASTNLCQVVKSSSNYLIAPTNESGIPRKITLGPRSNSNSSIISNVSSPGSRKMVKEATSKIASLWKKVEESKNKQRFEKPDSRQWITPNRASTQIQSPTDDRKEICRERLFRSSTFEGVRNDRENANPGFVTNMEKVTTV